MTWQPTPAHLESLSARIADSMGLHFGPDRWQDLARGVELAGRALGFADMHSWIHRLTTQPLEQEQIEVLAGQLTIGETYFMRENAAFAALKDAILPAFIRLRDNRSRRLRFWSAACCTGEEAYSIAITLIESIPNWKEWDIFILGTDINPLFLEKARRGVFSQWSFRDVQSHVIGKYFAQTGPHAYEAIPEIKRMVHFAHHNLAEPGAALPCGERDSFDVIFCRNVLMYFDAERQKKVVDHLFESLSVGGWLMPGLTEISMAFSPPFEFVKFPEAMFCQKGVLKDRIPIPFPPPILREALPGSAAIPPQCRSVVPPLPDHVENAAPTVEAQILTARAHANCGRLAEALTEIDKAASADKLNVEACYVKALILQEQGAMEQASEAFTQALYLEPNHILAHVNQGQIAGRLGKRVLSRKHLEYAIRLLRALPPESEVPESDGLTASQFAAMLESKDRPL
jgi:chemotaxis protein methyltransferase CheR